ncbi:sugar kinase [Actinoallomurus spadix]|uniref:Sugar kinase n=1 Tax=Actinoallomurus spadix TaxID=79912 RepID=A0ABN0WY28_9ACTN|nr:sugar kinase [Actinoallomurus spadix]MCO5989633.1 sugar kinase [Actinoallomurus spadix]
MTDVLTVGETMASMRAIAPLRLGGPMSLSVAGAESNVAIGLARLGHSAGWVGVVGTDELGTLILRTLRAEGVALDAARVDPDRPTGMMVVERRISDLTSVIYHRSGSAGSAVSAEDVAAGFRLSPSWVHLTGITPALGDRARGAVDAAVAQARRTGVPISLDVNFRGRLWTESAAAEYLRRLAPGTRLLIASEDELHLAAPAAARTEEDRVAALLDAGVAEVVIKRGARGASLYGAGGRVDRPARTVRVADTIGAGDAFVAGLLSATLDGLAVSARLERAVACGAFAVASAGDWEGLPTRADLALLDLEAGTAQR